MLETLFEDLDCLPTPPDSPPRGGVSTGGVSPSSGDLESRHADVMQQGSAPLGFRSVLKRAGQQQRTRGSLRVSFNESKNEYVEADYVILLQEEGSEPQLVSICSSPTSLAPLSPPDDYKDGFDGPADDSDSEANNILDVVPLWPGTHQPFCLRANLPDLVAPQLTVENVRHHDQMMLDDDDGDKKPTGILKGGKLWRNGKSEADEEEVEDEDRRRSVRFHEEDVLYELGVLLDKKNLEDELNDEQIEESVLRYEEMRRASRDEETKTCESRIRRIENSDLAGGVVRSNSEIRRAIQRNALRRSLTRFVETKKKDTNKNEKKNESSLIEKLRWLTASEDATNGNASSPQEEEEKPALIVSDPKVKETTEQYRKLAEMFNKTTSLRSGGDINVPGDVREWKLQSDLFPAQKDSLSEGDTFTAVPAVSICESLSDDECEKPIYSGGVRYTREGTIPAERNLSESLDLANSPTMSNSRRQFLHSRERSSLLSNSDYNLEEIDEIIHDDKSSSVPSSSQSSPRLSGRCDIDGVSTTESGYSSNETNGEITIPADMEELAEFIKQDAGRLDRLRQRYVDSEEGGGGLGRPQIMRGIKPRFGSTNDLLKQMASQINPPLIYNSCRVTWPYKEGQEYEFIQKRRLGINKSNPLPAVHENLSSQTSDTVPYTRPPVPMALNNKIIRTVHPNGIRELWTIPPVNMQENIQVVNLRMPLPPTRTLSHSSLLQRPQINTPENGPMYVPQFKRPTSVHGHYQSIPSKDEHNRPHSMLSNYPHIPLVARNSYPGLTQVEAPSKASVSQSNNHYNSPRFPNTNNTLVRVPHYTLPHNLSGPVQTPELHGHLTSVPYILHPVSSHLSYTTPIVPKGATVTYPLDSSLPNGSLELLKDERGAPEGASSSPRVSVDPQYNCEVSSLS